MNERIPERLSQLQNFGTQLIRQGEYVEATLSRLNEELQQLASAGVLPDLVYAGEVVLTEPYEEDADSGRAYLAVLHTARGFGAITLDTEEVRYVNVPGEIDNSEIKARMVPFAVLPVRVRARLAPQVGGLMDRLLYDLNLRPHRPASN